MKKGLTLIETLVYITLLSFLMSGVLSSAFMIIDSERRQDHINTEDIKLILEKYHE